MTTVTRVEDVTLPRLPSGVSDYDKRLYQALYDQFRDVHNRCWALETTLGLSPRKPGSVIPASLVSPLTTKGDIWGYSTTNARIPVGTNGQFLVADSTQALGVKWTYGVTTQTLTDAATVAWDVSLGGVAKVTLGGNRTLGAPSNQIDGGTYILRIIQDGTGSRTLAYNSIFKWPGGTDPVLSTAANAIDILTFVSDGTNMYGVAQLAFAT